MRNTLKIFLIASVSFLCGCIFCAPCEDQASIAESMILPVIIYQNRIVADPYLKHSTQAISSQLLFNDSAFDCRPFYVFNFLVILF